MNRPFLRPVTARIALLLVGWVVAVCLAQNSGFFSVCQAKEQLVYASAGPGSHLAESFSSGSYAQDGTHHKGELSKQCDLSEKMLSVSKIQLDNVALPMFILALAIVAWLGTLRSPAPCFTEPIPPKRRVHLTLCVFRE